MKLLYSDPHSKLYVSQIIDNLPDLAQFLRGETETVVNEAQRRFKAAHRRNEWLTVRAMLCQVYGTAAKVAYSESGRPSLVGGGGCNVSISHSKTHAALLLTDYPHAGVDLEIIGERILKLANRITSPSELPEGFDAFGTAQQAKYLTRLWAIKEAVYKSADCQQDIDMLTDIVSAPASDDEPYVNAMLNKNCIIRLHSFEYERNICSFAAY